MKVFAEMELEELNKIMNKKTEKAMNLTAEISRIKPEIEAKASAEALQVIKGMEDNHKKAMKRYMAIIIAEITAIIVISIGYFIK